MSSKDLFNNANKLQVLEWNTNENNNIKVIEIDYIEEVLENQDLLDSEILENDQKLPVKMIELDLLSELL